MANARLPFLPLWHCAAIRARHDPFEIIQESSCERKDSLASCTVNCKFKAAPKRCPDRAQQPAPPFMIQHSHRLSETESQARVKCMERPAPHRLDITSTSDSGPGTREVSQHDAAATTIISPPYWQHNRSASYASIDTEPPPITLEDHTDELSPSTSALWAKAVTIDNYTVVRGGLSPAIGAYVVWNVNVLTLDGGPMKIRKRYSEFDDLRQKLVAAFLNATTSSLPMLPPKSAIYKFRANFLERRRVGLQYFLNCVMLNPEYSGSSIVKDFIFAHDE